MEIFGFERTVINRRKGQHEYFIWSIKANTVLILHKKTEILYLLRQEFDPRVTQVAQESYRVKLDDGVVNIPIVASQGDQLKFAIFDVSDVMAQQMSELCKEKEIHLEVVNSKFNQDAADEFWNLLEMHQWLIKWRKNIREKDLLLFYGKLRVGRSLSLKQLVPDDDAVRGVAMVYELFRRGCLVLQDINSKRVCADSIFLVQGKLS